VGDCTWRPATPRDIDPTGDQPYRYRPRGHAGRTTGEIKGFLRSACKTMCAENFRVGSIIFTRKTHQTTGRPVGQRKIRGEGFIEAISGSILWGFIATPPPLLVPPREQCERRSNVIFCRNKTKPQHI